MTPPKTSDPTAAGGVAARSPTRVLVVDDHPMVRERLVELVNAEPGFRVCGEAADRAGTLAALQKQQPDLVLLDLRLKDSQGFELLRQIRSLRPQTRVLVVSMHDEAVFAEHVIAAGAHGYISKQRATRHILEALRTVQAGEVYLDLAAAEQLVKRLSGHGDTRKPAGGVAALSPRELEVFERLGQGQSSAQIARALGLDRRTVETYRARIKEKFNVRTADELLPLAVAWVKCQRPLGA